VASRGCRECLRVKNPDNGSAFRKTSGVHERAKLSADRTQRRSISKRPAARRAWSWRFQRVDARCENCLNARAGVVRCVHVELASQRRDRARILHNAVKPSAPLRRESGEHMKQVIHTLRVQARRRGLFEITHDVRGWVSAQQIDDGMLTLFCRHTSASLLVQENAAPAARADIENFFARLAPEGGSYTHDDEGPDDMPAHLRTALTQVHLSIPVSGGRPMLGTWQGIYLFEHRAVPTVREIVLHLTG
jgi:secondary thiamine-phosphate synthase enzyme